jgi:hypothetical protein
MQEDIDFYCPSGVASCAESGGDVIGFCWPGGVFTGNYDDACPEPKMCRCFMGSSSGGSTGSLSNMASSGQVSDASQASGSSVYASASQSAPEDNCEKCQYCNIEGELTCPQVPQRWDNSFPVGYTVRTSSLEYPFEVRTLWAQDALQQCIFDDDMVEGVCVGGVGRSFDAVCPEAPGNMRMSGSVPTAVIKYNVGCYAAADGSLDNCGQAPECSKSCNVECLYCTKRQDFVFNVTTYKALPSVDFCDLYLWYNTSEGDWCSILPTADSSCIAPAYKDIKTSLSGNYRMGPNPQVSTDALNTFPVQNLIAPGVYKWNVYCYSSILGEAMGESDWVKRIGCS